MFMIDNLTSMRRPPVAFRVIVWYGNIRPADRRPATLSDGAIFRNPADAIAFQTRVRKSGGEVMTIQKIVRPRLWYDSLQEFDGLGRMSLDEIEALKFRWANMPEAE